MDDQYCRLCMSEENLCCMDSSIRNCINNEFLLEINDEDELSKEICRQCEARVSKIIKFREEVSEFGDKITKVQKLLQKILKRKDTRTDSHTINVTVEAAPSTVETPRSNKTPRKTDETNTVDLTDTNVSSSNDLISKFIKSIDLDKVEKTAQKMRITSNTDNNFCTVCKVKTVDAVKFERHLKSSTHVFKAYVIEQHGDSDIFSHHTIGYKCPTCSKDFTSKKVLAAHSRTEHNKPMNSNLLKPNTLIPKNSKSNEDDGGVQKDGDDVQFKVKDEPDSSEMIGNPISKLKEHPCVVCKKTFGFVESLQRHQKKHHKGTLFCIHCDFTTISGRTFSDHIRKHYNLTHLQRVCSTCFKVCNSYSDLTTHRKDVHKTIAQVCLICNAKFATSTLLKKHKRDQHRAQNEDVSLVNKFRCRKCNRGYQTLLVLENHQCTNLRYPCLKKCGKRFESFGKMERHAAKCNTGKTIYFCKKCQKSLKTLTSFKRHLAKCLLKPPAPSTMKSNVEPAKKPRKTLGNNDERNQASCSSLIPPPPTETNDVSKKHKIDSAETSTGKKIKIDSEDTAHQSRFNCSNCYKIFSSVMELDNHRKSCRTTLIRIATKPKRKSVKTKVKKTPRSKLSKVKKVTRRERKKKARSEKNSNPPIPRNSMDNSKTLACTICGLLFKDLEFLAHHESSAHTSTTDDRNKDTTGVFKRVGNENIQPVSRPPEVPNFDNATRVPQLKWKHAPPPPVNQDIIEVHDMKTPPGPKSSSCLGLGQETNKNDTPVGQPNKIVLNWIKPPSKVNKINRLSLNENDIDRPVEHRSSGSKTISSSEFSKITEVNQTSTKNDVDRLAEHRSPGFKTISSSSKSSKIAEVNQISTKNDVDRLAEHRSPGFKPISSSSKSSKIAEETQTTLTKNFVDRFGENRSSAPNTISSSSKSSKIAEEPQTTLTKNHVDRFGENRSSGTNTISSSSKSSKIADVNQITLTRIYPDRSGENRSSGSKTISSSSEFLKIADENQTTPSQNDRRSTENRRSSEPKLKNRYSNSSEQETRISEISSKTPQNDVENRRSFQSRYENHGLDLSGRKSDEKPIEMNSKRPNDYKSDRFSSRHHIPGPRSIRWNGSDRQSTYTPTAHIDHRMPDKNRYTGKSHASFSSRLEPRVDFKQGSITKSPTIAPSTSQMSRHDLKGTSKRNDLTIIPITQSSICGICKNPNSHYYCNPCSRCFLKNEVQYCNHMKMKHS